MLDEFTSALDTATEDALLPLVDGVLAGRTVLLITHRLSALRLVDRVVELGAYGEVVKDCSVEEYLRGDLSGAAFQRAQT